MNQFIILINGEKCKAFFPYPGRKRKKHLPEFGRCFERRIYLVYFILIQPVAILPQVVEPTFLVLRISTFSPL